jgi:electron transfer flavoprotein alpha subunit
MPRMFAYIVHRLGVPDDSAAELLTAAAQIDPTGRPTAIVCGCGPGLDAACESVRGSYAEVWRIAHEALAYPNAELVRQALVQVLPQDPIVLIPHDHFGVDLAPGLSIRLNAAFVPDAVEAGAVEGSILTLVRQEFGGQVSVHVRCDVSSGAVVTVRGGAFPPSRPTAVPPAAAADTPADSPVAQGLVVDKSSEIGPLSAKRRYLQTVVEQTGDVDITKHQMLVSVGRGIQEADNVPLAEELAELLGGAVSCSRPVADAKWLDKSRQVGSSGKTVKPKVYLACGISGSFQHLAGLKGNPFIIAINKNAKAPIFRVADVGIVDDVLEFLPALTARIKDHVTV